METDVTKMVKRKRDKGKINSDWKRENEQWLLKILISKFNKNRKIAISHDDAEQFSLAYRRYAILDF